MERKDARYAQMTKDTSAKFSLIMNEMNDVNENLKDKEALIAKVRVWTALSSCISVCAVQQSCWP